MSNVKLDISWEIDEDKSLENMIIETAQIALSIENATCDVEDIVVVTDNENIREINNEQRTIDRTTDVLSFPMIDFDFPLNFDVLEDEAIAYDIDREDGNNQYAYFLFDAINSISKEPETA